MSSLLHFPLFLWHLQFPQHLLSLQLPPEPAGFDFL